MRNRNERRAPYDWSFKNENPWRDRCKTIQRRRKTVWFVKLVKNEFAKRKNSYSGGKPKNDYSKTKKNQKFKGPSNRCKRNGHNANDCWVKLPTRDAAGNAEEIALHPLTDGEAIYQIYNWCSDSGATSHMTVDGRYFKSGLRRPWIWQITK